MLLSLPLLIDQLSHLHEIGNDDDLVSALTDLSVVIDNNSLCSPDSEEEVKVEFANYVKERMDCDGLSAYLQSIELHREFLQQSHNKTVMDLGLEISDNGNDDSDSNQSGEFLGDQLFHFLGREKEGEEDTISEVEMLIPITVVKAKVDNFIVQQPIPRHHFPIMEFVNSNDLSDELSLARQQDDYTLRAPLPFYGEPRVSYSHRKSQIFSSAKLLGQTTKLPTEDIVSAMKDFHKNVKGYTHNNYFPTYGSGDNDTKNSMLRVNIAKGLGENSVNHPSFSFADFVIRKVRDATTGKVYSQYLMTIGIDIDEETNEVYHHSRDKAPRSLIIIKCPDKDISCTNFSVNYDLQEKGENHPLRYQTRNVKLKRYLSPSV